MEDNKIKKFTVVICTYNGSKVLPQVLEALLKQGDFDRLVEKVFVIDNASTDNTKDVIMKFSNENNVIKYHFENKQGLSYARRHACSANSEWVVYLDDDNVLLDDWLIELEKGIINNPSVGIVNGSVIPMPGQKYTIEQENMLKTIYKNLACTHLTIEESEKNQEITMEPFGAGLCIVTKALKKLDDEGWLSLVGRQGNILTSGEDTELVNRVLKQRYQYLYLYNYKMKMYHIIPAGRLTEEYANKLIEGLTMGRYVFISNKRFYVMQRWLRALKYLLNILKYKIQYKKINDPVEKINLKLNYVSSKTFLKLLKQDYMIKRVSRI